MRAKRCPLNDSCSENGVEWRMWIEPNYRRFSGRCLILFLHHFLV